MFIVPIVNTWFIIPTVLSIVIVFETIILLCIVNRVYKPTKITEGGGAHFFEKDQPKLSRKKSVESWETLGPNLELSKICYPPRLGSRKEEQTPLGGSSSSWRYPKMIIAGWFLLGEIHL